MSNTAFRTAAEQVSDYVTSQRLAERRKLARGSLCAHILKMQRQFGAEVTVGALVSFVGVLLVDGAHKTLIRHCSGHLMKCILRSTTKWCLTRARLLH
jgi:hypothetical protein